MTPMEQGFSTWRIARRLGAYDTHGYVWSMLLFIGFHASPLLIGLLTSSAIDRITGGAPASQIVLPLAILFGFAWVRAGAFYFGVVILTRFWQVAATLMKTNLLSRVVRGPGRARVPDSPGEAISRFRDDTNEYIQLLDLVIDVVGSSLFAVVALVIMARINFTLTIVCVVPMTMTLGVVHLSGPLIRRYRRESRKTTSAVTGFIGEIFGAVQAVKVADASDGVIAHFDELSDRRLKASIKDRLVVELVDSVNANLVNVAVGLLLLLAARSMRSGTFTVGQFTLFITYLQSLVNLPRWLGRLIARSKHSVVSMGRLARIAGSAEAVVEHNPIYLDEPLPSAARPAKVDADRLRSLQVRGLTCVYPASDGGVRDVSFDVEAGSFTVIVGRIGAGKTTLLRGLLGLVETQAGDVLFNGRIVDDPVAFFVPPRSAYTPQVPRLFSESLRDNILMGADASAAALDEVIHRAVFDEDLHTMHDGLETVVGPRGVRLSGGQIQRAAAARMFVQDAELLVFDDLSSALDVHTEATLWERVFARGSQTCLVVSHRHAALRRADQIVVLDHGSVVGVGRLDELLGSCRQMVDLWEARDAALTHRQA